MRMLAAILLISISSCGFDIDLTPDICKDRSGTYMVTFVERSGTCGYMPDLIVTVPAVMDSACVGYSVSENNNCRVTINMTCPGADGYRVKQSGVADWRADGLVGNAVFNIMLIDDYNYAVCSSIYDAVYEKM